MFCELAPSPSTFDYQTLISSSLSLCEHLCQMLDLMKSAPGSSLIYHFHKSGEHARSRQPRPLNRQNLINSSWGPAGASPRFLRPELEEAPPSLALETPSLGAALTPAWVQTGGQSQR